MTDDGLTNGAADPKTTTATASLHDHPGQRHASGGRRHAEQRGGGQRSAHHPGRGPAWATTRPVRPTRAADPAHHRRQRSDRRHGEPEPGGNVVFTPTADYNGPASFTYTVTDDGLTNGAADPKTTTATASFTITPVNDTPVAVADTLSSVAEDSGPRTILAADLLGNDTTVRPTRSGQTLRITAVSGANRRHGEPEPGRQRRVHAHRRLQRPGLVHLHGDRRRPDQRAADPKTTTATASFTITPVNDAPAVSDLTQSLTLAEDAAASRCSRRHRRSPMSTAPASPRR